MKNTIYILIAAATLTGLSIIACTEDPSNVRIKGVLDSGTNACTSTTDTNQQYLTTGLLDTSIKTSYVLALHITNSASTTNPWQSSGSQTGSGTTLTLPIPDKNSVTLKKISIKCEGEGCTNPGSTATSNISTFVGAESSNILQAGVPENTFKSGLDTTAKLKITIDWADSGVLKGSTNTIDFPVRLCNGCLVTTCSEDNATPPSDKCSTWGQDDKWKCSTKEIPVEEEPIS